ncbi:MAG: ABC transporter ATP-binding protein, partial [Verrucomicrobiota bacterium]
IALCIYLFAGRFHGLFKAVRERTADINTYLQERISGVRIVKTFATEAEEQEMFNAKAEGYYRARMRAILGFSAFRPLIMLLGAAGTLLVVYFGGSLAIQQPEQMSVGQLVEFVMYLGFFYAPVSQIGFLIGHQLPRGLAAADRVFEFLNTGQKLPIAEDALKKMDIRGEIQFQSVRFRYGDEDVLKDVSLTIPAGQTLALVGRSGVGKTTFVDLISRFYDPTGGKVLIDGLDAAAYHPSALRRHIGMVLQEPFLFNSTVYENIVYGRSDADEESVRCAAESAGAMDFISQLPDGINTVVGERGVKLSVGQKQRISIARALLKDPAILILDEATSSVDT